MRIHFIGIGGIGISALARYYLSRGERVTGSDLSASEITEALSASGVKIIIGGHNEKNLPGDAEMIIYSPAVAPDNPELKAGQAKNLKILSYPQALGELTKKYFTIAVCGAHGKSTTTAMIGLTLIKAGLDPTIIVGTKLKEFGDSNFRLGRTPKENEIKTANDKLQAPNYLVIEADEHLASFLNYWPQIIVLTRLEADHLDYYKNLNNIFKAFREFIGHLPEEGILVANKDDKNIREVLNAKRKTQNAKLAAQNSKLNVKYYSLHQKETTKIRKILKVPGEHNVSNALAVLAVGRLLKIPDSMIFKSLSEYRGAWRRFEIFPAHCGKKRFTLVSDYGHHPTEIEVTLKAARQKFPQKKIWCVSQPHQYQRTYYLFKDFVRVLSQAPIDKLILAEIYSVAGRESESIKQKVSSEKLARETRKKPAAKNKEIIYFPTAKEITEYLRENIKSKEVIIIMGAGDIYKIKENFA